MSKRKNLKNDPFEHAQQVFAGQGHNKLFWVLYWFYSREVQGFFNELDPSGLSFCSGSAQLAWFRLQEDQKNSSFMALMVQNPYLRNLFMRQLLVKFVDHTNKSKKIRENEERARLLNKVLKVLSQTSVTMTLLFLFSNKVSASDFPGNSFPNGSFQNVPLVNTPLVLEPTVQEKQRLLLRKVALLTVAVGALGAVGYVLSSRAVPYFIRLAPRLKETPVIDILTLLPVLPNLEVLEYIPVPSFLTSPFSQKLSTLGARIEETLDFFLVLEAHPSFTLKRYRDKSFHMLELISEHIDSLALLNGLAGDGKFAEKVFLLNDAFSSICSKNKVIESYCSMMQTQKLNDLLSKAKGKY